MDPVQVGIDVSRDLLDIKLEAPGKGKHAFKTDNTRTGHKRLIGRLQRHALPVLVFMEATGVYGLDLAIALHNAENIAVMVINPRRARRFAEALGQRAKTDPIDADCLLEFCRRMQFEAWQPPPECALQLRALTRRMSTLTEQLVQEKNRLHAAEATNELRAIRSDIKRSIRFLDSSIQRLEKTGLELVSKHRHLNDDLHRLCSTPGIAKRSAIKILAELSTMPQDLTGKQLTAFAGLDPKTHQSGTSVQAHARISKRGNTYLRATLYMPAHNAVRCDPQLHAFYDRLLEHGKTKMQAKVAVMRKLLVAINAMRRDHEHFCSNRLGNARLNA